MQISSLARLRLCLTLNLVALDRIAHVPTIRLGTFETLAQNRTESFVGRVSNV